VKPTRSAKRTVTTRVLAGLEVARGREVRDDRLDDLRRVVPLEPAADPLLLDDARSCRRASADRDRRRSSRAR
jgi:hypothetical protein